MSGLRAGKDLVFVILNGAFFVVAALMVKGVERLRVENAAGLAVSVLLFD